ncbi:RNA-binding S4 domain-containing protein [Glutamicibacter endophyticus]
MQDIPTSGKIRLDAWLWAVRIYKTRSAATTACRAGHVKLNGAPVKASQPVVVGDRLRVRKDGFDRELEVTGLLAKRVGASDAVRCYLDHSEPRQKPIIPNVPIRERGAGRPTKKDRRELDRLRASWQDLEL